MIKVLFIDDDPNAHRLLRISLPAGYTLVSGTTGNAGVCMAESGRPDVVLLDVDLPDSNGIEVLRRITRLSFSPPVIMLTGFGEIRLAVQAMLAGAVDFIEKPYDRSTLLDAIRKAARLQFASEAAPHYKRVRRFVGESSEAARIRDLVGRFAATDLPVLITGETGTGKDLVARLLHDLSARSDGPFLARNCGAIPGSLIESELFGSERGAFTDAVTRPGSFEQADGGTLFLDEIAEMPASSQTKLLRVLEDGRVSRIGDRRTRNVDVRIVSATNRRVADAVENGEFRVDLYFRVSTLRIHIPPLRERREDIPLLIEQILEKEGYTITSRALERLVDHRWPGNVRELYNTIQRAAVLSDGRRIDVGAVQLDALTLPPGRGRITTPAGGHSPRF